jgi:hypothetical protein
MNAVADDEEDPATARLDESSESAFRARGWGGVRARARARAMMRAIERLRVFDLKAI